MTNLSEDTKNGQNSTGENDTANQEHVDQVPESGASASPSLPKTSAPFEISDDKRKFMLMGVFITAGCIIALEILLFQMITYVSSYLKANQVISIALLGIAVGGFAAYYLARLKSALVFVIFSGLFALSVGGSFWLILWMSTDIIAYDALLVFPFALGATTISLCFAAASSHRVYFADLTGAGLSTIFVAFLIGLFWEENAVFALMAVAFLATLAYTRLMNPGLLRKTMTSLTGLFIVGSLALFGFNLATNTINIAEDIRLTKDSGGRIFWRVQSDRYKPARILFSRSSVAGRTDIIEYTDKGNTLRKTCENSQIIDSVRRKSYERYVVDPRLVSPDLIKDPDTLIIGTSGEGVLKPVRALGKGKVFGVEINPAVIKMFQNEAADYCGNCYDTVETEIIDARTYLKRTDRKFDYITLMNAHITKGNRNDKLADPEYLQTVEAITDYFAHLTDSGAILIEERDHGRLVNQIQILRLIHTLFYTIEKLGMENPADHIIMWSWKGASARSKYVQFLVKKNPLTQNDHKIMTQFFDDLSLRRKPSGIKSKINLIYSPFAQQEDINNFYGRFIQSDDQVNFKAKGKIFNIAVTTDNRPFPFNIYRHTKPLDHFLKHFIFLALFPLVPMIGVIVFRYRKKAVSTAPPILYFALIGVAYLVVEIVLIQKFNHFLGSPVLSLIVILGGMLAASGIGGYFSRNFTHKKVMISLVAVIVALILFRFLLTPILDVTQRFPLILKIFVALGTMGPLGFLMGVPFPYGLNVVKKTFSAEFAALMFGWNSIFASFGIPLSMMGSVRFGFSGTFLIGMALYIAALPFLMLLKSEEAGK